MNAAAPLAAAFARATYRIATPGGAVVRRAGVPDAAADAALRAAGCGRHWHVVTPCNPRAERLTDAANAARLAAFAADIAAAGWRHVDSCNSGDDPRWDEPGLCIFDAPDDEVDALARRHGQLALLRGVLGAAPALVWLTPLAPP